MSFGNRSGKIKCVTSPRASKNGRGRRRPMTKSQCCYMVYERYRRHPRLHLRLDACIVPLASAAANINGLSYFGYVRMGSRPMTIFLIVASVETPLICCHFRSIADAAEHRQRFVDDNQIEGRAPSDRPVATQQASRDCRDPGTSHAPHRPLYVINDTAII